MGQFKRHFKGKNGQELDLEDEGEINASDVLWCFLFPFILEEETEKKMQNLGDICGSPR